MKSVGKKDLMLARQTLVLGDPEKKDEGVPGLGQPEHTTMAKQRGMGPCTHMMMVCEVGRQKGLDAGPLDPREFWFLGLRKKDQGGVPV